MSNVVALRVVENPRPAKVAGSAAFDDAWKAYPDLGRLRSSRKEAWKAWTAVVKEVGEAELLGAVRRYVLEDKEHRKECGPPGFHRWLRWGRYEHWLGQPSTAIGRFPDDAIRAEVVAATSESFAVSYLDPCQVEGTVLIVRTGVAIDKLKAHAGLFRSLGFTGMRRA